MNSRSSYLSTTSQENLKKSSVIRKIFLLGQERRKQDPTLEIIDLSLGNPDLPPPAQVFQAMQKLADNPEDGVHRYMDNAGFPHVREKLAASISSAEKVNVTQSSMFMTCGAAGALHVLFKSILNPGSEVVLLAPYFVEYTTYVSEHGGTTRVVQANEDGSFIPNLEQIEEALNDKTRAIVLNSPNNPSGCVYPKSFFEGLNALIVKQREEKGRSIQVISDEPYANVVFTGHEHTSVLKTIPGSWLIRSHSKDLGLAGERIGYLAWETTPDDAELLDAMRASARALGFVNAPATMQRLLPLVEGARVETGIYEERVVTFCKTLNVGGVNVTQPGGTFFVLPRVPKGFEDEEFCEALAQKGVLVVPARAFGAPGHFRVSLTQDLSLIKKAANIIVEVSKSR